MDADATTRTGKTGLSPKQRRGELAKALRLHGTTLLRVLQDNFQVSHNHLYQVLDGRRKPGRELAERVARFVGIPVVTFWGVANFNESNQYLRRHRQKHDP